MADDDELPCTADWIARAEAAFKAKGRGSKAKCADELGFAQAGLTKILAGGQKTSSLVVPVSRWLKIAPSTVRVRDLRQVEILADLDAMLDAGNERAMKLVQELTGQLSSRVDRRK